MPLYPALLLPLATDRVPLCVESLSLRLNVSERRHRHILSKGAKIKEHYKEGIKEIYWILIIQEEAKDTRWALTDVNVSWIVWFE